MANALIDGGFEPGHGWTLSPNAAIVGSPVRSGVAALRLRSIYGFGPPTGASATRSFAVVPGRTYSVSVWAHDDDAKPPGATNRLRAVLDPGDGVPEILDEEPAGDPGGDYRLVDLGSFVAAGTVATLSLSSVPSAAPLVAIFDWYLDDAEVFYPDEAELMARSKMSTFLANLKAKIEALDPSIGRVFTAERRWSTERDLHDDGAILTISTAGLFDDLSMLGPVTRFWIFEPWLDVVPLTNCSVQYSGSVRVIGFFGWRDDHSQAETLRDAAVEIIDALNTRDAELVDLAAGMGEGYLGYLGRPPKMASAVRGAELQSGLQGHSVQILVGYSEEVARQ